MKVILYLATSINGYITRNENDSDWVSEVDWTEFSKLKKECGVMIMGSNTYTQFADDFPQEDALNIVMTHNPELLAKKIDGALFTDKSPKEVIGFAKEKGFSQLMLIGGMKLVTSFMKENLIDEIWLSIHPLFIGQGLSVTEKIDFMKELEYLGSKELDKGLLQVRYKVRK